jgi:membrane-associated phospholipid phosphatase
VTIPMVILVLLVPLYLFIPQPGEGRTSHAPALPLDLRIPLQPVWVLVYGALYLFLILLPVFVVRQEEHIRRTVFAYLTVWIVAYLGFYFYPTVAPRPDEPVMGDGFAFWALGFLYSSDPPYNCFPSLHVAHSFVSALTILRVHRGLGFTAIVSAFLVGLSTLFTKQHYILDVVAGILLASVACAVFLRKVSRDEIPDSDQRVAPALAFVVTGIVIVCFGGYTVLYILGFGM